MQAKVSEMLLVYVCACACVCVHMCTYVLMGVKFCTEKYSGVLNSIPQNAMSIGNQGTRSLYR